MATEISQILSLTENNVERGIRIRTKNIAIGDETTCNRLLNKKERI